MLPVLATALLCAVCSLGGFRAFSGSATAAKTEPARQTTPETAAPVRYSLDIVIAGTPKPEDAGTLESETRTNSQLIQLQDEPPDSKVGLERRVLADVETARKILHSQGYYAGVARYEIDWEKKPARIRLELVPGARARIGRTRISYAGVAAPSASFQDQELFPSSLEAFGLKEGSPAQAAAVLDAVGRITAHLGRRGYPFSRVVSTEYTYIRSTDRLDALVAVDPGPLLRMGPVRLRETRGTQDSPGISETYLNRLAPWTIGDVWNENAVNTYRVALQETGLFSAITLQPDTTAQQSPPAATGEKDAPLTPLLLSVTEAPARTVSGGLRYSTDSGFGVNGTWENRNLFGGGERLRLNAPIDQDLQMLGASFRKPAFGHREQTLVGEAEIRNELTDAYDQTAGYLAGGLERRLDGAWRHWWASARVSVEGGQLNDHLQGRQTYALAGLPLGLRRDTTDDMFNPTRGTRLALTVTPYTGIYDGPLTTVRSRLDGSAYLRASDSDFLVLAGRAAVGNLTGQSVQRIPASLRFYVGGGGSVRGYKYQSIGPKNEDGNPIGGLSFTDVGLEARFKVSESIGLVPFLDGGMVYDSAIPKFGKDMYWGAGLGLRYYTPIGPVRLDVGVPLQDRQNNKAFQIYLSLGQAF